MRATNAALPEPVQQQDIILEHLKTFHGMSKLEFCFDQLAVFRCVIVSYSISANLKAQQEWFLSTKVL